MATLDKNYDFSTPIPLRMVTKNEIVDHEVTKLVPFYKNMINPPVEVFSAWEPERSSINLTAVDYIRVADVANSPGTPSFYGAVRQLLQGNLVKVPAHNVRPLPFIDLKADDSTSLRTALEEAIMISRRKGKHAIMVLISRRKGKHAIMVLISRRKGNML